MRSKLSLALLLGLAACGSKHSDKTSPAPDPNATAHDGSGTFTGPQMKYFGHNGQGVGGSTIFAWSGSGVEVRASGTLAANMINGSGGQRNLMKIFIDGTASQQFFLADGTASYPIAMPDGAVHTVRMIKISEAGDGTVLFHGFTGALEDHTETPSGRYIEIIGDSISAGYGILADTPSCPTVPGTLSADPNLEDVTLTYGVQAAIAVNADWAVEAWSGKGLAHNRTASDTLTMANLYNLTDPTNSASVYTPDPAKLPAVVVVNLGTNDWIEVSVEGNAAATPAVAPVTTKASFTAAYVALVGRLRAAYPDAFILLAIGPMLGNLTYNAGPLLGAQQLPTVVAATNDAVAQINGSGDSKVSTIQFTANATVDYGCDYHPNAAKHASMAAQLADTIRLTAGWN